MDIKPQQNLSHQLTKEIRFAVVLYGGVSLAIYMNGITQELLSLARATKDGATGSKDGTEAVYREIADHLLKESAGVFSHKFIVDIISGTSAGGINGICLAKGLVNGIKNLKALENTWLEDGNIDTLLNDRKSQLDLFSSKEPKSSLLNSQRMYGKLLEAFIEMENNTTPESAALVDALDLFVTATDLRGIEVPISLSDGKADEHIYKQVFHFLFRKNSRPGCDDDKYNHFTGKYSPLLAFASRCTSSFPFAFEPMCLNDMFDYLKTSRPKVFSDCSSLMEEWRFRFFKAYNKLTDEELNTREFADGGFLDNRPFGHAIKAVHARHATCPVERKLLFIDPSPEKSSADIQKKEKKISFIKNSALATTTLPRYETIREEITGLKQRNRWIATVNQIVDTISTINQNRLQEIILQTFISYIDHPEKLDPSPTEQKTRLILQKIKGNPDYGQSNISLRSLTENHERENIFADITDLPLADIAQKKEAFWIAVIDDNKIQGDAGAKIALKKLGVHSLDKTMLLGGEIENEEISLFVTQDLKDLTALYGDGYSSYHYTKISALDDLLALVITRAAEISDDSDLSLAVQRLVEAWRKSSFQPYHDSANEKGSHTKKELETIYLRNYDVAFRLRRLDFFRKMLQNTLRDNNAKHIIFKDQVLSESEREAIHAFYATICETLEGTYNLRDFLLREGKENPVAETVKELRTEFLLLLEQAGITTDRSPGFAELSGMMDRLMESIHSAVMTGTTKAEAEKDSSIIGTIEARKVINEALKKLSLVNGEIAGHLKFIFDNGYDLHDITTFPLFSGGEYGEGSNIGIYRISPLDATSLAPENSRNNSSKLAGTALGAFGAFLDRNWRRNDIMWGRLDGAERVITALLPNPENDGVRRSFIDKAHRAIVAETVAVWLPELKRNQFSSNRDLQLLTMIEPISNSLKEGDDWKSTFKKYYTVDHEPEPAPNLKRVGRSSDIVSQMINGLDDGNGFGKKISHILKMFSTILLGLLDFTTPKSLKQVLLNYWLQLLFLVALLLCITGTVFKDIEGLREAGKPGFYLLFAVLVIWAVKTVIENLIHRMHDKPWKKLVQQVSLYLGSAILLVIASIALSALIGIWSDFSDAFLKNLHRLFTIQ